MNLWDRAAWWSARRWLRRLDSRLQAGHLAAEHDELVATALAKHIEAVRAQVDAEFTARIGLVEAPYLVLLAIYAEELLGEATRAGWRPPLVWTALDGLSLRLLACCQLARTRPNAPVPR